MTELKKLAFDVLNGEVARRGIPSPRRSTSAHPHDV
jgi:hypothetical protein